MGLGLGGSIEKSVDQQSDVRITQTTSKAWHFLAGQSRRQMGLGTLAPLFTLGLPFGPILSFIDSEAKYIHKWNLLRLLMHGSAVKPGL